MICVTLPWPPSALRPNASSPGNWRKKQLAAKLYKSLCAIECRAQGLGPADLDTVHVTLRFCPPDRRRRDADNLLASVKHGIDAISEIIGIDDSLFSYSLFRGEVVRGGEVRVTITEHGE